MVESKVPLELNEIYHIVLAGFCEAHSDAQDRRVRCLVSHLALGLYHGSGNEMDGDVQNKNIVLLPVQRSIPLTFNLSLIGLIPVICLIYLNTRIYRAMKTIKTNINNNKKKANNEIKGGKTMLTNYIFHFLE